MCVKLWLFSGLRVLIFLILTIYLLFFSLEVQAQHHPIRFGLQMVIMYEIVTIAAVSTHNKHLQVINMLQFINWSKFDKSPVVHVCCCTCAVVRVLLYVCCCTCAVVLIFSGLQNVISKINSKTGDFFSL